jgi:L-2-hydroxyglutarate oxidase LhgO
MSSLPKTADIVIIGGGIIGSTIARAICKTMPTQKVVLLEKESELGQHTSTRNSGVLHSGIYYRTDSMKAKFCREGNELLTSYMQDNRLPLRYTGKYIVA